MFYAIRSTLYALRWNFETLEHWNFRNRSLIPYGEKIMFWNVTSTNLHPLTGKERKAQSAKRKEIPFITHLSALHTKLNALRYTLYALRWNFETLEPWNFRNRSLIPYGEKIMFWNVTSTNLHPLRGKSVKHRA